MRLDLSEFREISIFKFSQFSDNRGSFDRLDFEGNGISKWDSLGISKNHLAGTLRGFHFQREPFAQHKLITCIKGAIVDFVLDLRPNSETFGHWGQVKLLAEEGFSLSLPPGFAHGFQTLEDQSWVMYNFKGAFNSNYSEVISMTDPNLCLDLPIPIANISIADSSAQTLSDFIRSGE